MSPLALAVTLAVALGGLGVALNHCYARMALVELALNEGLPPGHQRAETGATSLAVDESSELSRGVHVFLSRGCHACQRLIEEVSETTLAIDAPLHLRYIDRARPIAHSAASVAGAHLSEHQVDLVAALQADPLPYTIAVGSHGLVGRAVTPTVDQVLTVARDAGISADRTISA